MDLKQRNSKLSNDKFPREIVVTKKQSSPTTIITYLVVPLTKVQIDEILEKKKLPSYVYDELLQKGHITSNPQVKQVGFCGKLIDFTGHSEAVTKFPQRKIDIREGKLPYYRQYTKTVEQQKEQMCFYNSCRDSRSSWNSVIQKCGSEYGILLKIQIDK